MEFFRQNRKVIVWVITVAVVFWMVGMGIVLPLFMG